MKQEQIESILFTPVGGFPYRLKKVEIKSPMTNVAGLILIEGEYYKQELDKKVHQDYISRLVPPFGYSKKSI
jgi:hypothetical protein